MDLNPYLSTLRESLATTASAGDEQLQRAAAVLAATLEPAARLTLMNALSDLAAEVTAQLPDHVVEVRLDGRDVRVVVTGGSPAGQAQEAPQPPPPPPPPPPPGDSGDISRMTLRLFEHLKTQAEQAAAAQGVSLNTFVAQAVQGALQGKPHGSSPFGPPHHGRGGRGHGGSHLHGWVRG
ncbi:toxin-antitoxin system HicB family antitoxin [Saccharomonospora xinjiangensis]|uniref:Protein encoded in hypervariable junctions of pilus gene clusters n=1 Tax=Saccharomonospora xinjiangensis XJ-54 TaxID=882086 RepID=I0V6U1_9PSEU|nr:toxin-antitoxin system HicB family antitoxin [Saccharomonospora xinjiangensis]EID55844.1 protein encoded in hypervariable junctions of pilus gene clusters [Saccharomonospora xinjiangensis XJ-54]